MIIPATTATIDSLTSGISSAGGSSVFRLQSDGAWNASVRVNTSGISGEDNDTGSFNIAGAASFRVISVSGSYSPTRGIAGTHLIDFTAGPEDLYLNPAGSTGLSAARFGDTISYELRIHARNDDGSDGAFLDSATVRQGHAFGGRTVTVPSTWFANDPTLISTSQAKPSWTFYL